MIRLLPQNLINQIAAGEVVERPASTIKELVENALDAQASQIDITIRDGGRTWMCIRDNGQGIARDDLSLAIQRHATSKLPDDDLLNIQTMGFRGEALPAIGAVSRLKIASRHQTAQEAWQICVEGGDISGVEPVVQAQGTTIEVADLFFATPARLKFLKTAVTEASYITDAIQRLAMAYPQVGFTLKDERRTIFDYKAMQSPGLPGSLRRLGEVMGQEFAENALLVDAEHEAYTLRGYIGLATLNRSSASQQFLCVNGRPVKDKVFTGAVRMAYQDFLARDRYPMVALFLNLPPLYVDMNVHPAKTEVRFRDSSKVRGLIVGAIRSALNAAGHRASTTVSRQALGSLLPRSMPPLKSSPAYSYPLKQNQGTYETAKPLLPVKLDLQETPHTSYQQMLGGPARPQEPVQSPEPQSSLPLGIAKAQIHETYIVAEAADELIIVDQHAAHERILYEQMKQRLATAGLPRQALLIPEVVELSEAQVFCLVSREESLKRFGLTIEKFGPRAVLVRETPSMLGAINVQKLILDLVDEVECIGDAVSLKEQIEKVCSTLSCHASIRAGRQLTVNEMNELLRQMETTPHSGQCNHGRPTYVALKKTDIEKLFGRR